MGLFIQPIPILRLRKRLKIALSLPVHEQLLKVRLDARHRGGKIVTLVEGFSGTEADLEQSGQAIKVLLRNRGISKKQRDNNTGRQP